jgi:hypothetical protein
MNTLTSSSHSKTQSSACFPKSLHGAPKSARATQRSGTIGFVPSAEMVRQSACRSYVAQNATQSLDEQLWSKRGLTEKEALRLLVESETSLALPATEDTEVRVRRLQLEALALSAVLSSIVVACASLVLS